MLSYYYYYIRQYTASSTTKRVSLTQIGYKATYIGKLTNEKSFLRS